jgi:hypothetical protein
MQPRSGDSYELADAREGTSLLHLCEQLAFEFPRPPKPTTCRAVHISPHGQWSGFKHGSEILLSSFLYFPRLQDLLLCNSIMFVVCCFLYHTHGDCPPCLLDDVGYLLDLFYGTFYHSSGGERYDLSNTQDLSIKIRPSNPLNIEKK